MTDETTGEPMADEMPAHMPVPAYDGDEAIAERHRELRGTDRLLYYPPDRACETLCRYNDSDLGSDRYKGMPHRFVDHQCCLVPNHDGSCVFSSECEANKRVLSKEGSYGILEEATVRPA